jgi:hypothetical protein
MMADESMPIYDLLNEIAEELKIAEERGANGVEEWVEARDIDMMEWLMFSKDVTLAMLTADGPLTDNAPAQIRTAFQVGYEFAARKYAKEDPR